ncbi:glutathione S-transferase family protein [Pseudomonas sp. C32]|uniref:glutathione S-transferase family protein n=1 Tax=Pseudomonas sp. C32 TaxID=1529208 RepID=UPI0026316EA6|nr:glutathione S-transferase family protein [Pseudomonas sp. C32]MDN4546323.1 glutathione S-transferase family protein [Pseudomonas sp. C32]
MSTLELYNAGVSTCSQRVRFVLAQKGLAYTDKRIRLEKGEHLTPEYLAINANGLLPALVHDGRAIVDSSVINEYLEEVFPEVALIPKNPYERAQMRAWVQYLDEVMTPAIRYPSFQKFFGGGLRAMSSEQREAFANRLPLRKHFALEVGSEGFPQKKLDDAMERIQQSLLRMETALQKTQWISHIDLTLADIAMMPSIVRLEDLGLASLWADMPNIADWYARLQMLPAFAKAYSPGSRLGVGAN